MKNSILLINYNYSAFLHTKEFLYNLYSPYFKDVIFYSDLPDTEILNMCYIDQYHGYFGYISNNDKYQLPSGFYFIFGLGHRIMSNNPYNVNSDIGLINDIWLGGILYTISIYVLFSRILLDIYNNVKDRYILNNLMFYLFTEIFIICNLKGYIFAMNNFTNLVFLCYTFLVLTKKEKVI